MCELDVFAGNFTLIDWDIHALWIDGFTAAEAVTLLKLEKEFPDYSHEMLESDVNDCFRTFSMLENVILSSGNPSNAQPFDCFSQFQLIDAQSKTRLVETYYSLDAELCR